MLLIFQSSLTIDGIKYIIDSGYQLLEYYDPKIDARCLDKVFISQAQVKQRMGRSGRTSEGICYHLYTNEQYNKMDKYPKPNILTNNIYEECLKLLGMEQIGTIKNLTNIFNEFIDPPNKLFVNKALQKLTELKLIDHEKITNLGKLILSLNVEPMVGLTYYYAKQNNCLLEIIGLFSLLETIKNNISKLFIPVNYKNKDDYNKFIKIKKKLSHKNSDHLSLLNIFIKNYKFYKNNDKKKIIQWCNNHCIHYKMIMKSLELFHKTKYLIIQKLHDITINSA